MDQGFDNYPEGIDYEWYGMIHAAILLYSQQRRRTYCRLLYWRRLRRQINWLIMCGKCPTEALRKCLFHASSDDYIHFSRCGFFAYDG
jgi:hypothetical protein